MPDHMHGIIVLDRPYGTADRIEQQRDETIKKRMKGHHPVNEKELKIKMSKISPTEGSLSTIVRSYKSAVTKASRAIDPNFEWQSRFYERIIRNKRELRIMRAYIRKNPRKWMGNNHAELR